MTVTGAGAARSLPREGESRRENLRLSQGGSSQPSSRESTSVPDGSNLFNLELAVRPSIEP